VKNIITANAIMGSHAHEHLVYIIQTFEIDSKLNTFSGRMNVLECGN